MKAKQLPHLNPQDQDRLIEMAWEDRTPFEAIEMQFNYNQNQVITLMRYVLKPKSFERWRKRAVQISHKHRNKRPETMLSFRCSRQKNISHNRIT